MSADNEKRVREFCAAWSRRNIDELLEYFTDDAVYHNVPVEPVQGKEAIRGVLNMFVPPAEKIDFEMLHVASNGALVFTERVDRFLIGGRSIALPVAGVFELRGGKISAWRDYFDMQSYMKQAGGS
jgi:limonene-1,2-epoxide hydrolase